jgi:hypothetical protein
MKVLFIILSVVLFSSCSHYKWAAKHQAELCANCPQENTSESSEVDTTIYGEIAADTVYITGLDTIYNTVIIDNPVYKIIKEKGEIKVIIKEKRVPFTVTRYKSSNDKTRVVEVKVKYIPFWIWLLLAACSFLSFGLARIIFK